MSSREWASCPNGHLNLHHISAQPIRKRTTNHCVIWRDGRSWKQLWSLPKNKLVISHSYHRCSYCFSKVSCLLLLTRTCAGCLEQCYLNEINNRINSILTVCASATFVLSNVSWQMVMKVGRVSVSTRLKKHTTSPAFLWYIYPIGPVLSLTSIIVTASSFTHSHALNFWLASSIVLQQLLHLLN